MQDGTLLSRVRVSKMTKTRGKMCGTSHGAGPGGRGAVELTNRTTIFAAIFFLLRFIFCQQAFISRYSR